MTSLRDSDVAKLRSYGITDAIITNAQIRRVTHDEARDLGMPDRYGDLAGVLYPRLDPTDGHVCANRLRRDHPGVDERGQPIAKYVTSAHDRHGLYFPPGCGSFLGVTTVPAVLVEAYTSALAVWAAATRAGRPLLPIATCGCWGWRSRHAGKSEDADGHRVDVAGPVSCLSRVTWTDRTAVILFDANAATNTKVQAARAALADELSRRGARVLTGTVPADPGVNGPDDYRRQRDDRALLALVDDARPVQPQSIDELLDDCGLQLAAPVNMGELETALRRLRDRLRGADGLRVATVKTALTVRLRAAGVPGRTKLLDAALCVASHAPTTDDTPRLIRIETPAADPVDGVAVLGEVHDLIRRYVVCDPLMAVAVALWVAHTYLMDVWNASPLLLVTSPTKRCGKTRLLVLTHALVCRALLVTNMTTATLFRLIEREKPTLLLDEADTWLSDERNELRGLLNGSHTRSTAVVPRCVGDDHDVKLFSTWAAKALGMIGRPAGKSTTLTDRCIVVELQRRLPEEPVDRLQEDRIEADCADIRSRLARWAADHAEILRQADPAAPSSLDDRAEGLWRPLIAIADAVGGDWPQRARQAADALSGHRDADTSDAPAGIVLLADIRDAFANDDRDVIPTTDLLTTLRALPERPWAEWAHGKGLTGHALSRLLRGYHAHPDRYHEGMRSFRGYRADALRAAWGRYTAFKVSQCHNTNEIKPIPAFSKCHGSEPVTLRRSLVSSIDTGTCDTVTLQTPSTGVSHDEMTTPEAFS